eukprot:g3980.t1
MVNKLVTFVALGAAFLLFGHARNGVEAQANDCICSAIDDWCGYAEDAAIVARVIVTSATRDSSTDDGYLSAPDEITYTVDVVAIFKGIASRSEPLTFTAIWDEDCHSIPPLIITEEYLIGLKKDDGNGGLYITSCDLMEGWDTASTDSKLIDLINCEDVAAEHLGCFSDSEDDRVLDTVFESADAMTNEVCVDHCAVEGASLAATQFGSECWCLETYDMEHDRHGASTMCNYNCTGNPMRVGSAQREIARSKGERFLAEGYALVPHHLWTRRFRVSTLPTGAYFWYKSSDNLWWLGKISRSVDASPSAPAADRYIVRFLDDPGPIALTLSPTLYSIALGAPSGSWCLQCHRQPGVTRGVLRNADTSRGAPTTT